MSAIDLMLLGALMDQPMNAYEMKKRMERQQIQHWVKISSPAVYRNLLHLHRRGLLDSKVVREGEMPEKAIYSVNEKGKRYFVSLMEKYSEAPDSVYIDFTALVANLYHLEPSHAKELMEDLQRSLESKIDYLKLFVQNEKGQGKTAEAIIGLYIEMYELFRHWAKNFSDSMEKGEG
jgi:DNA-binding PadR family transcriptional regulator